MSDKPDNLVLELLRAIRTDIGGLKSDNTEIKERLGFLENAYASISRRVDRIDGRLETIEKRLGLVDA